MIADGSMIKLFDSQISVMWWGFLGSMTVGMFSAITM